VRPAVTLTAFAAALAVVFAAALGLGSTVGPVVAEQPVTDHADDGMTSAGHESPTASTLPGLAVSDAGWTLHLAADTSTAGPARPFRFTVTGPDGEPETAYRRTHTKQLHLIVVRRDLSSFQHLHPVRAADGSWSVPLGLPAAGSYRVFADFQPKALDRTLTLGADLSVPGDFTPTPLPAPTATTTTTGGYDVTLAGTPVAGRESDLVFSVSRSGQPVTALQPYLGAYGHLVSLRTGDLAFLHTHPTGHVEEDRTGGPDIAFGTTFPTAGTYRLFLDFRIGGTVRTAAFTVDVGEAP
jgi:hypothetical protein